MLVTENSLNRGDFSCSRARTRVDVVERGERVLIYVYRIVNFSFPFSFQPYKHFFFIVKAKIKHFSRSILPSLSLSFLPFHAYTQQENKKVRKMGDGHICK